MIGQIKGDFGGGGLCQRNCMSNHWEWDRKSREKNPSQGRRKSRRTFIFSFCCSTTLIRFFAPYHKSDEKLLLLHIAFACCALSLSRLTCPSPPSSIWAATRDWLISGVFFDRNASLPRSIQLSRPPFTTLMSIVIYMDGGILPRAEAQRIIHEFNHRAEPKVVGALSIYSAPGCCFSLSPHICSISLDRFRRIVLLARHN